MKGERPGRGARLWGSLGALVALALCFSLAQPNWNRAQMPAAQVAAPSLAAQPQAREDALDRFRQEREQVREMEINQLRAVAADEAAGEEIRAQANRQLLQLTAFMEQEVTLEGLLRAQGFADVLCTVHADSVNVLVRQMSVTRSESALILDTAMRETGQAGGSVKVIPVGG